MVRYHNQKNKLLLLMDAAQTVTMTPENTVVEDVTLWIEPIGLVLGAVNYVISVNGTVVTDIVGATSLNGPQQVWVCPGLVPSTFVMSVEVELSTDASAAVNVYWLACTRNPNG